MTTTVLALDRASFVLPDGRNLFSDLTEQFDTRRTGLVGRNGAGKSVLARLLAGELEPAAGRCLRPGSVYYLAQHAGQGGARTVAELAGAGPVLAALERIEAGSLEPGDFEAVGEGWDIRQRLAQELKRAGLGHLAPSTPVASLSGGQAMRVALAGAALRDPDVLILDEPSNHLDRAGRQALATQLLAWRKGLIVISHDRELLGIMERIVELSEQGLRSYGGDYAFYEAVRRQEQDSAARQLEHARLALRRDEQERREQRERQARRQAQGKREGKTANQAAILLGGRKERSEGSTGRLRVQHEAAREEGARALREAALQLREDAAVRIHAAGGAAPAQRRVALLEDVVLPFARAPLDRVSLGVTGRQRIGIEGPNGCGKSTLLKVLGGVLAPLAGEVSLPARVAWLDQQLGILAPARSTLDQLLERKRSVGEDMLRTWLVQLGLDADAMRRPSGLLSGGERLKAALACVLYADEPPELLLLDEPGNHLDLPSLAALEAMLNAYQGALAVVSHDAVFLERIGLTQRLRAAPDGWRLL
ncbi:ABC-F family ATP-binding cassette domain-containing protein [Massilia sp. AB1]|uniref:ABC-F family ATP-binding cassette domain-containing protein n=1 Tax=Massilia sp. AB1 TaxID=2823371 RepID=UPI001B80FD4F|nr:ABC-F family ATP-binding cassette domain-containing protein [Massilia sp. AB1]MBQ5941511.1 ABC-F family ATP-binding cassette domain-containing protein [Massilia sp. AB1]